MSKIQRFPLLQPPKGLCLDLGCGNNKQPGFKGVDITKKGTQADVACDLLEYPWPFKDNSVEQVFASHYLEHLPHINSWDDHLFRTMNEVYRILKKGGLATFITPYYTSQRAIQDPTHQRSIGEATYLYFTKAWRKINKLEHYPIKCDFEIVKIDHSVTEEYQGHAQEAVQYAATHYWNVISDIVVVLKKK